MTLANTPYAGGAVGTAGPLRNDAIRAIIAAICCWIEAIVGDAGTETDVGAGAVTNAGVGIGVGAGADAEEPPPPPPPVETEQGAPPPPLLLQLPEGVTVMVSVDAP